METPGEWLGKGAEMLGLEGRADREHFERLCDNLHPQTGEQLTAKNIEGRRTGWDFNFNATKSVGMALELTGDHRVLDAHKEAVEYTVKQIEQDMATRVRAGGLDEDRNVGNLVAMHVIHRTTRPNKDDLLPDMSLHSHVVVFNTVFDPVEDKWKAAQVGDIKRDANYFEAVYHNRLAGNLRDLGYGIKRTERAFEIAGISDELMRKYSRRSQTIEQAKAEIEAKYGVKIGNEAKSKLGATTRLNKIEMRGDDLQKYWLSKLTPAEGKEMDNLIGRGGYESTPEKSVGYAIGHAFERQSVVGERWVKELALRHGVGSVTVEAVEKEAERQGLLTRDGEATTKEVLAEEGRIIAFARDGRGTMRPMGNHQGFAVDGNGQKQGATLSAEQQAVCRHIWQSPDRVIMINGDAGSGKTSAMHVSIPGIDKPGVFLAPSADASRGVLREQGFSNADTVHRFLNDRDFAEKARGGYVYIDEAPLMGSKTFAQVLDQADKLDARVILQGDTKQHKSIERGNIFHVLHEHAGLPVGRLTTIKRQKHDDYKKAVSLIANGDMVGGYDVLDRLGWVVQTPEENHNKPLVDAYIEALETKKASQKDQDRVLIVAPTHVEGDEITADLRERLKEEERLDKDEKTISTLVPLGWTDAQKGDSFSYTGDEQIVFHRNSGRYRAGDVVSGCDFVADGMAGGAEHFNVYRSESIALSTGDTVRFTKNVWTADKKHRLDNGRVDTIKSIKKSGDIELSNGWIVGTDAARFLTHGYVSTSHASQGKTVDKVLIALGQESLPAVNAEQWYVSVSRARDSAQVFTDVAPPVLREAIQRSATRKSATELMQPKPHRKLRHRLKERACGAINRLRQNYRKLRERMIDGKEHRAERGLALERA